MLSGKVDCIFVNFPDTKALLPDCREVLHVGTPLRAEFLDESFLRPTLPAGCEKYILCFGGSLGAKRLNSEVLSLMAIYGKQHPEICIQLATGDRAYAEVKAEFENLGLDRYPNLLLSEYIYDMPYRMRSADLLICRSGAMTLSEVACAGKASILIPSPNVTNDQQTKNASVLSDKGAAVLMRESELTKDALADCVRELMENESKRYDMAEKVKAFAVSDASLRIWQKIKQLTNK